MVVEDQSRTRGWARGLAWWIIYLVWTGITVGLEWTLRVPLLEGNVTAWGTLVVGSLVLACGALLALQAVAPDRRNFIVGRVASSAPILPVVTCPIVLVYGAQVGTVISAVIFVLAGCILFEKPNQR